MSCCKPFVSVCVAAAKKAKRCYPRGMTLIELLVAQVIVGIIAAGMFALIGGMTKSFHEEQGAAEAQVRLREASSALLRTLQGIGGSEGKAGYLVLVGDGGATAADSLTVFRPDFGLCAGVQSVSSVENGNELHLLRQDFDGDTFPDCPINTLVGCQSSALEGSVLLVEGASRGAQLLVTAVDVTACSLEFGASAVQSLQVAAYNQHFSESAASSEVVLTQLGVVNAMRFGHAVTFSIDPYSSTLVRSINGGPPTRVLDGVYDLQVVTAHDLPPADGAVSATEWNYGGTLSGASPENFFGVRVGLMTFGAANAGIEHEAPRVFANRFHTAAPKQRRYRYSWVFAAARNR